MIRDTSLGAKAWSFAMLVLMAFLLLNIAAMIATVVTNSFATRWLRSWLPEAFTARWYGVGMA
jgi:putative spermidine/putrescine transport system permease protein